MVTQSEIDSAVEGLIELHDYLINMAEVDRAAEDIVGFTTSGPNKGFDDVRFNIESDLKDKGCTYDERECRYEMPSQN